MDDIQTLAAASVAHGILLKAPVKLVAGSDEGRRAIRDFACAAVEGLYEADAVTSHGHLVVQGALQEIESLLGPVPPKAEID